MKTCNNFGFSHFLGGGVHTYSISALCVAVFFAATTELSAETVRSLKPKFTSMMTVAGCTNEQSIALANFPVPVRISTTKIPGFYYNKCDGADDISFSDESGNILPHEVEVWNTEGESVAWVSVPQVYTNAVFYMNWGHKTKLETVQSQEVWTAANYVGVWHMNEYNSTEKKQHDSTGKNTATYSNSSGSVTGTSKIGLCYKGSGTTATTSEDAISTPSTKSTSMTMDYKNGCSFSAWVRWQGFTATAQHWLFEVNNSSTGSYMWGCNVNNKKICSKFGTSTATQLDGTTGPTAWFNLTVCVTNNTSFVYFLNGEEVRSTTSSKTQYTSYATTSLWRIGGTARYLDEVRYRNGGSISADWIKAEYDSVNNNDFLIASDTVRNGGGFIIVVQ